MKNSMKKIQKIINCATLVLSLFFIFSCGEYEEEEEVIEAGTPDVFVTPFVEDINSDTIKSYVQWMQNYTTRFFLKDNRRQIAVDIKNKFIQLGYNNARIDSFYFSANWDNSTYNTWQYNVIASLEGSVNPNNIYVIGAHYDCIVDEGNPFNLAPGANDNASGVAGVIEVARIMKKRAFIPKNTIEFVAFASEEYDLNGSTDYANKTIASNKNIIMMLNNDMIAYDPNTDLSQCSVNVMDYENSGDLRTQFVKCGKTYTALQFACNNDYNEEGDSYTFSQKGRRAIFIISNVDDSFYHTVNDVVNNYNYKYCKEIVAISCALLVQENK